MNILFIKHFCVGFMVSEIPRVSVLGHCPYSFTIPYIPKYWGVLFSNLTATFQPRLIQFDIIQIPLHYL